MEKPSACPGWDPTWGTSPYPARWGWGSREPCFLRFLGAWPMQGRVEKDPVGGSSQTHRVAGIGPLHLREASHFSIEYIHLLYQGGECCLGGLTYLLINTFGLRKQRRRRKKVPWAPGPLLPLIIPTYHLEREGSKALPSPYT